MKKRVLRYFSEPINLLIGFQIILMLASSTILFYSATYIEDFEEQTRLNVINHREKVALGNIIKLNLLNIEKNYKSLLLAKTTVQASNIISHAKESTDQIEKILPILENGGVFINILKVNDNRKDKIVEKIVYNRDLKCTLEKNIIDIAPKIVNLNELLDLSEKLVLENIQQGDKTTSANNFQLAFYTKRTGALLNRITEESNELIVKINSHLDAHKKTMLDLVQKRRVTVNIIQLLTVIIMTLTSLIIAYKISLILKKDREVSKTNWLLSNVVNQTPSSVVITDTNGLIEYVNPFFEKNSGYTFKEVVGKKTNILKSKNTPKSTYANLWNIISSKGSWSGVLCNVKKDKTEFYEEVIISPVLNRRGDIINYVAVKIDITEKIEMQQNLEQNNVALNSIIDNIPVGVVLVDKNKNIQQANKATADMLHYDSLEELNEVFLGKRCDKDFCKINSDLCPIIHLNEEKVLFAEHELYIKSDIPKKTITVIKSSIPITINNTYYIMEVFVDISERKKNELKLEEETIRANLMAEEANSANRAKRDFLANMSHEIRTPMNGVIGMSDVLLETNLSEEQRSYAKTVKESANSLLTIINDILDFSKIEAGKLDIENKDFDLSKLLINVATTFAFKTDEKGLELICKMSDSVPQYIVGDEIRIRQIITNLLGNAVKFTQKGEVVLSCKTMIELADSYILKFSIKDTGIGIDENQQVLLFDKFTQADGSITRRFGGTGLGLTISKQLAHLMNGDIGVISTLEKGSTFWFTIEVSKSEIDKKKLPITPLKTLNVLVIDDNETSLSHIGDILKSHSINNCLASSGKIGLDKIEHSLKENTPFDIILIDADMPNMSGEKTELLISQKFPSLTSKKALLTSISNLGQCKQELCDRFDSFIAKPIHKYSLFITLTELHNNTYKRSNVKSYTKRLSTIKISNKGRSKILLVEDNKINQIVAKTILMKLNTDITVAGNGLEAVQLLQKESFDLVFMDIQMPLLGGVDSTKQIRDFNSLVPIIAMTANAMKGDREEYLSAGMNGYIAKPVSIKAIREALESWIPLT